MVEKQSRTLNEARREYKRRYKRDPPLEFNRWYEMAIASNATVVDNFDTIVNALEPFWRYSASDLRKATELVIDTDDRIIDISIKNGALEISQIHGEGKYTDEIGRWIRPLLEEGLLPDMRFAFSALDEPRVVVSDGLGLVVYEHSIFPVSFRLDLIGPSLGDAPSIHLDSSSPIFLGDQILYSFYI